MRLLIVTRQFGSYTGATISTLELIKKLNPRFDDILIVTLKTNQAESDKVKVIIAKNIIDILKEIKKLSYLEDLVGYSDDHFGIIFSFFGIPYIHTYHGNWPDVKYDNITMFLKSFFFIPMYKITIRKASFCVSVSEYMKYKFVSKYTNKVKTIYNGIKSDNEKKLVIHDDSSCKYLMVGNIDKRKYSRTLKLFKYISTNSYSKLNIDIYGTVIDKAMAKRLACFPFVHIKGNVKTINYEEYMGIICTSSSENMPVSIIEALKHNLFVMSFNVGGINEVVRNNENGLLFNFSKHGLSSFGESIEKGESIRWKLKKNRNEDILKRFDWEIASEEYFKLFKAVYERRNE